MKTRDTEVSTTDLEMELGELKEEVRALPKLDVVVVGRLSEPGAASELRVEFAGCPGGAPVTARSIAPIDAGRVGTAVALVFEGGDPTRPIVLGPLTSTLVSRTPRTVQVDVDGERLEIGAKKEIALRVGRASITLTADGKIVIRGAHLVSRSAGVNRIQGGSVQIN